MKKLTLLAVLTFTTLSISSAFAVDGLNFGRADYSFRDYDGSTPNQNGINLIVGREITHNLTLDGRSEFRLQNGTESTSTRLEGGLALSIPLYTDTVGYVRGAVGEHFANRDKYSYYSIEPGIMVALDPNWALSTSYRYRDSFENGFTNAKSTQVKVGVSYALTSNSSLVASVGRNWGNLQYTEFNVGYGFVF